MGKEKGVEDWSKHGGGGGGGYKGKALCICVVSILAWVLHAERERQHGKGRRRVGFHAAWQPSGHGCRGRTALLRQV